MSKYLVMLEFMMTTRHRIAVTNVNVASSRWPGFGNLCSLFLKLTEHPLPGNVNTMERVTGNDL